MPAVIIGRKRFNVLPAFAEYAESLKPKLATPQPITRSPVAKVFTPATSEEREAIKALSGPTYPVASAHKRFGRQIQGADVLTDAQRAYLWAMVWRYRRQISNKTLIATAKAIANPPVA